MVKYITDFKKHDSKFEYLCIVMEYIEGLTLKELVEKFKQDKRKLKTETILGFFVQLVTALRFLHE